MSGPQKSSAHQDVMSFLESLEKFVPNTSTSTTTSGAIQSNNTMNSNALNSAQKTGSPSKFPSTPPSTTTPATTTTTTATTTIATITNSTGTNSNNNTSQSILEFLDTFHTDTSNPTPSTSESLTKVPLNPSQSHSLPQSTSTQYVDIKYTDPVSNSFGPTTFSPPATTSIDLGGGINLPAVVKPETTTPINGEGLPPPKPIRKPSTPNQINNNEITGSIPNSTQPVPSSSSSASSYLPDVKESFNTIISNPTTTTNATTSSTISNEYNVNINDSKSSKDSWSWGSLWSTASATVSAASHTTSKLLESGGNLDKMKAALAVDKLEKIGKQPFFCCLNESFNGVCYVYLREPNIFFIIYLTLSHLSYLFFFPYLFS